MNTKKHIPDVVFHSGETLSEKLKELGMGVKEFAVRTSKPEKTIFAVIKGDSSITSDMAVAFESVTRIPAHFWLNKQRMYDEYVAREKRKTHIDDARNWARKFPVSSMAKLGWVNACRKVDDKVTELFKFFQVSTHTAWENYFFNQQLKVAFRISLSNVKEPYAISAWLRCGEIEKIDYEVLDYSEKELKNILPEFREFIIKQPDGFDKLLQKKCASVGV